MNKRSLNNATANTVNDVDNTLMHNTKFVKAAINHVVGLTADEVIHAIVATAHENIQNYDYKINLIAAINIGNIYGNYIANYRFNKDTNELIFKYSTSGDLLNKSTEYISSIGSTKIRITTDEKGIAKKVATIAPNGEELYLNNNPFKAIIDHIDANNLLNITNTDGDYMYKAKLSLPEDNQYLLQALSTIRKMSATVDMRNVSINNLEKGIDFFFNMSDDKTKITDIKLCVDLILPIKGIETKLAFSYEQRANSLNIRIPNTNEIIADSVGIAKELSYIANALNVVKNSATYSLELNVMNKFDSSWKHKSSVSRYHSRLYKNTNDKRIDFNHSTEYQAYTESGEAIKDKHTYCNISDGAVYLVLGREKNESALTENISVNTQFDYMVSIACINFDNIDCIKKTVDKDGISTYNIYLNTVATSYIEDKINEMFNFNSNEKVIDTANIFIGDNYLIDDSVMVVEMIDAEIKSIAVDISIKYFPIVGDNIDEQISLTNSIKLDINTRFHNAAKYKAPKNAIELTSE